MLGWERCCTVCLFATHGLLLTCTHSTSQFARCVSFLRSIKSGRFWFPSVSQKRPALEIVARSRKQQHCPNFSTWRHETHRAAFGNVKTTLRASLARHAVPVLSAVSFLLACSELRCTPVPAVFRSLLAPCEITRVMVQPCQWRGSGGCRVHSGLSRSNILCRTLLLPRC